MSFGGFGLSLRDVVLLVQQARGTFRNCQKAGNEYADIASEVRCLHGVLRTVRTLAERPDSSIFRKDRTTTAQLTSCADGCKHVLDELDNMLTKYAALDVEGQPSVGKKLWQRFRFGSKIQELGVVRGKLITYTSTMSILIDTMQSEALDRVENKIDDGFGEVKGEFERMRKEIYSMATQARTSDNNGSSLSLLSLSTYAGDEKEVWRAFRRELVMKGFRSRSLDKYRHVLQAYMLKLDESGLLDNPRTRGSTSANEMPWWSNRIFADTVVSLSHLSKRDHDDENPSAAIEAPLPAAATIASDASPVGTQPSAGNENVDELQQPPRHLSPDAEPVPGPPGFVPSQRKVAFTTTATSRRDRNEKRKGRRSIKSILRYPTPAFPEDPNYVPEGVGLWEHSVGGKVPSDARITQLDKKDFDITAVRLVFPRCEDRQDHILVFQILDDIDIAVLTKLTAIYRDYPQLELHWLFDIFGESISAFHPKFFIKYGANNEKYSYGFQPSNDKVKIYMDSFGDFVDSISHDDFNRQFLKCIEPDSISGDYLERRIVRYLGEPHELKNGLTKLCTDVMNLSERDAKALDMRLTDFAFDITLWFLRNLGLPSNIVILVREEIRAEDKDDLQFFQVLQGKKYTLDAIGGDMILHRSLSLFSSLLF